LGILAVGTYVRKGDGGDGSESQRWFAQAHAVEQLGVSPSRLVHVMDREADNFELLARLVSHSFRFVIRADDDRVLVPETADAPKNLTEVLARTSAQAIREVSTEPMRTDENDTRLATRGWHVCTSAQRASRCGGPMGEPRRCPTHARCILSTSGSRRHRMGRRP
jgi:hypothetical protein